MEIIIIKVHAEEEQFLEDLKSEGIQYSAAKSKSFDGISPLITVLIPITAIFF